jgi:hypothetical protein
VQPRQLVLRYTSATSTERRRASFAMLALLCCRRYGISCVLVGSLFSWNFFLSSSVGFGSWSVEGSSCRVQNGVSVVTLMPLPL